MLQLLGQINLLTLEILTIIFTSLGIAAIILLIASKYRMSQLTAETETDTATVTPVSTIAKLTKQINIVYCIAGIMLVCAMITIFVFSYYNKQAKKYGAYDNIQLSQSINQIKECAAQGFIESENIPDDMKGNVIIYFKYGCPDCASTHDDIMKYLETQDTSHVYFVSTRSAKGKELLKQYPVPEVPSAVYVRTKESPVSDIYMEVIYKKTQNENGEISTFDKEKLDFIMQQQIAKE